MSLERRSSCFYSRTDFYDNCNSFSITRGSNLSRENIDDEVEALALQLEEIRSFYDNEEGKYRAEDRPDNELVISAFRDEVTASLEDFDNLKLAQSIACALDTDVQAIADIRDEEIQAEADRRLAIQISRNDPELENPPTVYDSTKWGQSALKGLRLFLPSWFMDGESVVPELAAGPPREERRGSKPSVLTTTESFRTI
ncbi:uncharacterized protein BDV17DRAFT_287753 [Aspergillus undulatus]|uniref:uncharacterized protein n=1 Tax=Aspergillus undulatus TaxID=1810928 RepID=UPI003CCE3A69